MRDEHISTANYAAVIADLRAKRDEIDRTIAMLEKMASVVPARAKAPVQVVSAPQPESVSPTIRPRASVPTPSFGIGDACARILRENAANGPLSTREVTNLVIASGFAIETQNPVNNVWSALNQRTKTTKDVERVGKAWRYVGKGAAQNEAAYLNGHTSHVPN